MTALRVQVGVAARAKPGEVECGDQATIVSAGDRSLVVLADGVGHGPEAAHAARAALLSITREPWIDLGAMLERCHRDLAHTRGAALAIVRVDAARGELEHAAVGNVDVTGSTRDPLQCVAVPGIVGARMRKVLVTRHPLHPGDIVVIHTDGVSRSLDVGAHQHLDAPALAAKLVEQHASVRDDAACVVVRC